MNKMKKIILFFAVLAFGFSAAAEPRLSNWPVDESTRILWYWGPRPEIIPGVGRFHSGIDFDVPEGTPVLATGNGIVIQTANHLQYGKTIVIRMDNGLTTADIHLNRIDVTINQNVAAGQQIGLSGNTGLWTNFRHLHFSVWAPGANIPDFTRGDLFITRETIDPLTVLPPRNRQESR